MSKKKIPSLIIEHVADQGNLNLLSMLEHKKEKYLVLIDNIDESTITAYVLDFAQQEGIDLVAFIGIAEGWLAKNTPYPFSFELSRLGLTETAKKIYKTFDTAYVTRLVGRPFKFQLTEPMKTRRRRAAIIPKTIEIRPVKR